MLKFPEKLSDARILITNDDSIHSEGIKVLEEIAKTITPHVWVVAPENQQSAAGHSITINMPLRIKIYDDNHVSVLGTPTDSTLVGVQKIMKGFEPHLVLSGINHGQNTADDVTYSGTISAAVEATLMSIPAIAFSQDMEDENRHKGIDWNIAREYIPKILESLEGKSIDKHTLLNVNLPVRKKGIIPEVKPIRQGHFTVKDQEMVNCINPRGHNYYWIGKSPKRDELDKTIDVGVLKSGNISITPLNLNLTHQPTMKILEEIF